MTDLRLALVRHGQTDANVRRELDSRPPGRPLNALGREQADALARRLADAPVTAVYASQALRAQQTAQPVAAAHGLAVDVLDGVHEVFVGDLEGRSDPAALREFDVVYGGWWRGELDRRLPGGESAIELRARYLPAVEQIADGARGTIVLVSHGAAIRLAAARRRHRWRPRTPLTKRGVSPSRAGAGSPRRSRSGAPPRGRR